MILFNVLPHFLFLSGIIISLVYFAMYFNNYSKYNNNDPSLGIGETGTGLGLTGFILSFVSLIYLMLKNFIETDKLIWKSLYSIVIVLLLVQILVLYVLDVSLSQEPASVDSFKSYVNINFFDNWLDSVRASTIISFLFLYILINRKIDRYNLIVYFPIFILITLSPIIIILSSPDNITTISEKFYEYGVNQDITWYDNRNLSYYSSFSGLFTCLIIIFVLMKKSRFKKFIK